MTPTYQNKTSRASLTVIDCLSLVMNRLRYLGIQCLTDSDNVANKKSGRNVFSFCALTHGYFVYNKNVYSIVTVSFTV